MLCQLRHEQEKSRLDVDTLTRKGRMVLIPCVTALRTQSYCESALMQSRQLVMRSFSGVRPIRAHLALEYCLTQAMVPGTPQRLKASRECLQGS
jgi:hypothetical protein